MFKTTALICAAALGLAACGSSSGSGTGSSSSSKPASAGGAYGGSASSSTTKTTAASSGGSSQTLVMQDYKFQPKTITGKPGSTVKITLKNEGTTEHNFKIDAQVKTGADADVEPGKTGTATVKIPTSGSIQFYCEYHKGLGMIGTVKPA